MLAVEQYEIENTYQQEKDEKLLKFLVLFLDKHCFCVHRSYFDFVDMPSLCSARYICLAANSICFRYAQTRYDINPRSLLTYLACGEECKSISSATAHIKRVGVYRKSALADLYRCVPALWQVRYARTSFFA